MYRIVRTNQEQIEYFSSGANAYWPNWTSNVCGAKLFETIKKTQTAINTMHKRWKTEARSYRPDNLRHPLKDANIEEVTITVNQIQEVDIPA